MPRIVQTALRLLYPPQCLLCRDLVESDFGLCGACWRDTPFIGGLVCDGCGVPLPGDPDDEDRVLCDECLSTPRAWDRGRAALLYRDNGRRLVLGLKHNDRHDVARPAAKWLARTVEPLLQPNMVIAPVPLHWTRLAKRRYNQSALITAELSRLTGHTHIPDLLQRVKSTKSLDGHDGNTRRKILSGSIRVHPRRKHRIAGGRPVLVIDDVLTTGATCSAATEALRSGGAGQVCIGALARVLRED